MLLKFGLSLALFLAMVFGSPVLYDITAVAAELNQAYSPQKQVNDRDMSVFNRPARQVEINPIKDENGQAVSYRNAQAGGVYSVSIIIRTWMTPYGTFVRVTNNVFMDISVRVKDTDGTSTTSGDLSIPAYSVAEYVVPPGANTVWVTTATGDRTIFSVNLDRKRGQSGIDTSVKYQHWVGFDFPSRSARLSFSNEAELPLGAAVSYRNMQNSGSWTTNVDRNDFETAYGRRIITSLSLDGTLNPATRVATVEVFDLWNEVP